MTHRRELIPLEDPRFLTTGEGMGQMPPPIRLVLRLIDVTEFLHLKTAG